ncbi:3123_t:CDS:2 [Cetraspora pellucida]|uniref:3123_t:CDS:1 n=1 Tax=Cetraspora pellucida TaxID=1433469 RepID=A0ACA9KSI5_9GLOM|nr:3123_t:CDS:2 [Cetraspora pellucida]
MFSTTYRTESGRIPPNQEEVLLNNSAPNIEEFRQEIVNIINEDPPSYDYINEDAPVEIQEVPQNTNIDTNYISERITQEYQEIFSRIKILDETIGKCFLYISLQIKNFF